MASVFRAPAKLNLTLEVLARRDDGFHGIRSVMVPLELADELTIEASDRFSFACDREELGGEDNLVVRAVRALGDVSPHRLVLRKHIPVQAGLGGGSSDAAAVLRAAMSGAFGSQPPLDWLTVARALGSDVPFFLAGTGALVEGTGERVTPLGVLPPWHALVLKPPAGISTSSAFAQLDKLERPSRTRNASVSIEMVTAMQRADFEAVETLLYNDFQMTIAAGAPAVSGALDALRTAGASNAMLAGSGSCVFTLTRTRGEAESILQRLALPAKTEPFVTAFGATPDWRA
jgi:4-diphosphocytidyl-2-C-methyl-D-erythritol kinase